ncbi:App1 family protein [Roseivivax sp. CAU 1753]
MVKRRLARVLHPAERLLDRFRPARRTDNLVIDSYLGYATPSEIIFRGRVLTALRRTAPSPEGNWWTNLRQMVSLFLTSEVASVEVKAGEVSAITDEEGYFHLHLPRNDAPPGWAVCDVTLDGEGKQLEALVVGPDAPFGVISDIDDTVLETGAYSLARNLWTSLTGNALTRHVFPDAVALMRQFEAAGAPVFFVSSSPWNLHHFLVRILTRHDMPKAPIFLRDLGLSRTQFISGTHGDHKGSSIDAILSAHPGLPFVLIGDTGQHDPPVYLAVARRHPGRIVRAIFREPGKGADAKDRSAMEDLRALGVEVESGRDYSAIRAGLHSRPE